MAHGMYSYNQFSGSMTMEPIEDIRLAATIVPASDESALRLELRTTGRLDGGPIPIAAVIEPDGRVRVVAGDPQSDDVQIFDGETIEPLAKRSATQVEFWFVDQEATVWVDGRRVLQQRFDYSLETLKQRPSLGSMTHPSSWPAISIRVEGGPATLSHVKLDRDMYYSQRNTTVNAARGALIRRGNQWIDHRLDIQADEFFCLGDNGPQSLDGRYWGLGGAPGANAWILQRMFANEPNKNGLVPRELMMGRAFFVYWPPMYPFKRMGVLPNFGDMRFIH
jgi:hypothetical protein